MEVQTKNLNNNDWYFLQRFADKVITWHITSYINLVDAMIRHQNFHLVCRELPAVALSHHVKVRENY